MTPTLFNPAYLCSDATLSPCGKYRYDLWRVWDDAQKYALFVMLNPSTADAFADDPTIRRCVGFARAWGYGGIVVTNLFAFRATDPRKLRVAGDPIGPDNDKTLSRWAADPRCGVAVCAWGAEASVGKRPLLVNQPGHVLRLLRKAGVTPHYLRLTKDGHPAHPLYLPAGLVPAAWGSAWAPMVQFSN